MRVLGIDPGYAIVGWGVIDYNSNRFKAVAYGAIQTEAGEDFNDRLEHIFDGIAEIIERYKPDAVAIEELFFNTNTTTAIGVAEARGVILVSAKKKGLSVFEYTPLQIKKGLTGYGRAAKKQIMGMIKMLLNLQKMPSLDDTCDALAVAICHARTANSRLAPFYNKPTY